MSTSETAGPSPAVVFFARPPMRRCAGRLLYLVLALFSTVLLGACIDDGGLAAALSKDYGRARVRYGTGDQSALVVTFPTSPFAERADAERRRTALKVAEYVRDHYPRYKGLDKVVVEFMTKKEVAADTLQHVAATYTFTRAELDSSTP